MINNKKIIAIIPARGGSKGVPRKNIRNVAGKPLIAWTIEEAKKSKYIDRLILSSEDDEIIQVAKSFGCEVPFVRPACLAQDDTPSIETILHALDTLPGYDYIVLLQPTSPLRNVYDIDGCIEQCVLRNASSCATVTEPNKSPYWMYTVDSNGQMHSLISQNKQSSRRQDLPQVYALNGAVYVAQTDWLYSNKTFVKEDTLAYVMPQERSTDIDTELDLIFIQAILQEVI